MLHDIDRIHGLGPTHQALLASAEIRDHKNLLKFCRTHAGRKELSEQTGLAEEDLRRWTVQAELMRIPGLGSEEAHLLEKLGIHSFAELKREAAEDLRRRITELDAQEHLLGSAPTLERVKSWLDDAAILTPKLGES